VSWRHSLRLGMQLLLAFLLLSGPTPAEPTRFAQAYYRDEAYLNAYRQAVRYYNPGLDAQQLETVVRALLHYAHHYRLDPRLVTALVACESGFRPEAVSSAGARGLGQLMPGTAREEGIDPGPTPFQHPRRLPGLAPPPRTAMRTEVARASSNWPWLPTTPVRERSSATEASLPIPKRSTT